MCGLFGMMGNGISGKDIEMMRDLAYVTGLRGMDGAGVMQGKSDKWNKRIKWDKTHRDINYFLTYHKYHKDGDLNILNSTSMNFYAGHCRWMTKGAVETSNSHPFDTGNYVSMHNGTLNDRRYQHAHKTDSQMMFEDMEKRGVTDVLRDLEASSAYAIVMFSRETGDLVFARNKHRKIYFCYNRNRAVVYWSSEKEMLILCAARNDIDIGDFALLNDNVVYSVSPDSCRPNAWPKWYTCDVPEPEKQPAGFMNPQKTTTGTSAGAIGAAATASNTNTIAGVNPVLSKQERKQLRKREAEEKKRLASSVPSIPTATVGADGRVVLNQEALELQRAGLLGKRPATPEELIAESQAKRVIEKGNADFMTEFNRVHNTNARFQNPGWSELVETGEGLWEDLHTMADRPSDGLDYDSNGNVLDNEHTYPSVIATSPDVTPENLKFNPRRVPHEKCDWCDQNLSLLEAYYAKRVDGGLMCLKCDEALKDSEPQPVTVH